MDYAAHIHAEEAHAITLARIPGWRDYIKAKVKRMATWQPALYGHLPALVTETINQEKADASL